MNADEKAKLDYQMGLEKEKLEFARGLRWRELLVDKGIFGLTVILLGGLALFPINCYLDKQRQTEARGLEEWRQKEAARLEERRQADARGLEAFKLEEARRRFLMEKRFEAIIAISTAHNAMVSAYFRAVNDKAPDIAKCRADHRTGIDQFLESLNRAAILFNDEFAANANRYLQVHRSIRDNEFGDLCSNYVEEGKVLRSMNLKPIPYEERIKMSPSHYLDEHVEFRKIPKSKP